MCIYIISMCIYIYINITLTTVYIYMTRYMMKLPMLKNDVNQGH